MIRTAFYAVFAGLYLLTSPIVTLLPVMLMRVTGLRRAADRWLKIGGVIYSRGLICTAGVKVSVRGAERYPRNAPRLCIVSNHQSLFDILLLMGYLPNLMGFIAKKELGRIPILNLWMPMLGSVLIHRNKRRSAIEAISKGVERIKAGRVLAIFPEGTRSRSGRMGRFKPGSLKLALRADAVILPVTIDGSHRIFEGSGGIQATEITITVHEPVPTKGMPEAEQKQLAENLEETVRGALADNTGDSG